jgi:pyruvoyl-dependent arginine decarboxylase (PvlArgDC)
MKYDIQNLPHLEFCVSMPSSWFAAKGTGQSDNGHLYGSMRQAMQQAGLEKVNITGEGFGFPVECAEIPRPELPSGAFIPAVYCAAHGTRGQTISAAMAFAKVYDSYNEKYIGAVLSKNTYFEDEPTSRIKILNDLETIFEESYGNGHYTMRSTRLMIQSMYVSKLFGTALVAACFASAKNYILGA